MARFGGIVGLTLALGASVFVAWSLALGRLAGTGLGTVLRDQPFVVLGLVALFAAAIGAGVGVVAARWWSPRTIVLVLVGAWIGELVVLIVAGLLLANEITPATAPWLWLLATGGPVQPAAAVAGGWLGRWTRRGRARVAG
jgi:hypothetical protein